MKSLVRNLSLLAISFLVALGLGEILIRIVAPQQLIMPNHHLWRPDPEIGWRHVENANTQTNSGEGLIRFVTDSNGYRIDDPAQATPAASDGAVLAIGDSFLEAVAVENHDVIPSVLQRLLSQQYGLAVQVVNDGVGAWGPSHYLKEADIALRKRSYDLALIFIYSGNDVMTVRQFEFSPGIVSADHDFRWPRSVRWNEIVDALFYPVNDWLETRSHLFIFLKQRLSTVLARVGLTASYFPAVFKKTLSDSPMWLTTRDVCRDIRDRLARDSVRTIFVLLPPSFQIYPEELRAHLNMFEIPEDAVDIMQPNRLLADAFAAESLVLLDALPPLREKATAGDRLYGLVDSHLNAKGHTTVAEWLVPFVAAELDSAGIKSSANSQPPVRPGR